MLPAVRTPAPWLVVAAIVAVALNLRPLIAATGPLLDAIQASTGLSDQVAGLLTTLPILVMGLCALGAAGLQRWLGTARGITLGMGVVVVAGLLRWIWPTGTSLVLSAVAAGLGIAVVQALMPGFIKTARPEAADRLMGLYSTGIMGGAVFAGALSPTVASHLGWPAVMGLWSLPAALAALLWHRQSVPAPVPQATVPDTVEVALWRNGRAWRLMLFFGIGTAAYTLALAWLAPYYLQLGWTPTQSGLLLAAISAGEVLAGLGVSLAIGRLTDRRWLVWAVLACLAAALVGLLVAPLALVVPITALLAIGIGALFPLSLIITLDHVADARQAGALLGFVQGGGYMLASLMPFVAGLLRGSGHDLSLAWALMLGGVGILVWMARAFRPGDTLAGR